MVMVPFIDRGGNHASSRHASLSIAAFHMSDWCQPHVRRHPRSAMAQVAVDVCPSDHWMDVDVVSAMRTSGQEKDPQLSIPTTGK